MLCAPRMSKLLITSLLAPLAVAGCATAPDSGSVATATTTQQVTRDACPAGVPAQLAPAADQDLSFFLDASGVQIYRCAATASGYAWSFVAPDADLYLPGNPNTIVGHHFAGPTWEYIDGSTVVAAKAAAATPDPGSIAWLLLVATSHGSDGRMSEVSSIQRLSTHGGNAPATGCDAAHAGDEADVPYTATYYFYVTRDPSKPDNVRCGG